MTASLPAVFSPQFFTNTGALAASYRLYTYAPGTTTQKVAYTDAAATTPHTYTSDGAGGVYIALNVRGELPAGLYLTSGGYDLALKDTLGATVWTRRAYAAENYGTSAAALADLASTATGKGAALVAYLAGVDVYDALQRTIWLGPEYGAATDGTGDCTSALTAARTAAGPNGVVMLIDGANYRFTQAVDITADGTRCAQIMCRSWATFTFSGVSGSSDCVTVSGGTSKLPILLEGVDVQAARAGRDAVVVKNTDGGRIRVKTGFSQRDGLVLYAGTGGFIENLHIYAYLSDSGRHAMRRELAGSDGAFINECTFHEFEARRWSQVTAGACGVYSISSATSAASKISNTTWLKTNGDVGYSGSGPLPDTAIWVADRDAAAGSIMAIEMETFVGSQGWENTGSTDLTNGYTWDVRNGATWVGLFCPSILNQSKLGGKYANPSITRAVYFGFGTDVAHISGYLELPTNPSASGYIPTAVANATGDGTPALISTLTEDFDRGACLDPATGKFTAATAGLYRFSARIPLSGISGHTTATLQANVRSGAAVYAMGDTQNASNTAVGGAMSISGEKTLNLWAGDFVQAQVVVSGASKVVALASGVDAYIQFQRVG